MIPPAGRQAVLELLHEGHPGVFRMKNLARSYVWWPQIDKDIEIVVKTCYECQQTRHSPPVAPLHPWECLIDHGLGCTLIMLVQLMEKCC